MTDFITARVHNRSRALCRSPSPASSTRPLIDIKAESLVIRLIVHIDAHFTIAKHLCLQIQCERHPRQYDEKLKLHEPVDDHLEDITHCVRRVVMPHREQLKQARHPHKRVSRRIDPEAEDLSLVLLLIGSCLDNLPHFMDPQSSEEVKQ